MNNIDKLLSELKEQLHNEECVKQYFYYKNIIENNPEIKKLEDDLRFHQKEMCKNKDNAEVYATESKIYNELKNEIDNNPILINYQTSKDEVYSLLVEIKDLLG